jgi:hypothetical protein
MILQIVRTLLVAMLLMLQGCILAGFAASVAGPPPVPAEYVPEKLPMLVIVRDPPDPMGLSVQADALAAEIEREIVMHDIAPLIPASRAKEFQSTNLAAFAAMTPAQIGHAVGAKQVLLVQITNSSLAVESDDQAIKGQIAARAVLLNSAGGMPLWPEDGSGGATMTYATPTLRIGPTVSAVSVRRNVHQGLAVKIVRPFHKYKPGE